MTILDDQLRFAVNHRPTAIPLAVWFPFAYQRDGTVAYIDLKERTDIARADALYANFRVDSAYNSIAANLVRFAAFVSDDPTFGDLLAGDAVAASKIIAQSHEFWGNAMGANLVGTWCTIALPPLSQLTMSVTSQGFRYLALGQVHYIPATDFSSGGVSAWLTDKPLAPKPIAYPSGY